MDSDKKRKFNPGNCRTNGKAYKAEWSSLQESISSLAKKALDRK